MAEKLSTVSVSVCNFIGARSNGITEGAIKFIHLFRPPSINRRRVEYRPPIPFAVYPVPGVELKRKLHYSVFTGTVSGKSSTFPSAYRICTYLIFDTAKRTIKRETPAACLASVANVKEVRRAAPPAAPSTDANGRNDLSIACHFNALPRINFYPNGSISLCNACPTN